MKKITVRKRDVNVAELEKRSALPDDCSQFVDYDCIVVDQHSGENLIVSLNLNEDLSQLVHTCHNIKYAASERMSGIKTTSKIFGFRPRMSARMGLQTCSATALAFEDPTGHNLILNYGRKLAQIYQTYLPDSYLKQLHEVQEMIRPDWIIEGTPFTSGIVNKNNPLKYHFDKGNFDGMRSVMLVLRENMDGGLLCVPEYDIKFLLKHGQVIFFDGQALLHGVTRMKANRAGAYRYSLVYYSLKQMCKCLSPEAEIRYGQNARLQHERNRK